MTHSLYLLAAAWLASAGGTAANAAAPVVSPPVYADPAALTSYPTYSSPMQAEQPSILGRLRSKIGGLFGKKPGCGCNSHPWHPQQYQAVPQAMPGSEPPLADQVPLHQTAYPLVPMHTVQEAPPEAPPEAVPAAGEEAQEPAAADQEINNKYIDKVGHEEDYTWVTGQLYKVRLGSGPVWVVRYATVDTEDKFGGSVVLAPAVNMKNFREGDLVSVKGDIISEGPANKQLGGPLYRVTSIDMIERAD